MDAIADDDPPSLEALAEHAEAGCGWVAVDESDIPVGYVIVDVIDDCAHIDQISVRPELQGRGIGRALLARVRQWSIETGRAAVTLTTFADVPWNRPVYERLGFRVLHEVQIGPELAWLRELEAAQGLDPTTRVCMCLELP